MNGSGDSYVVYKLVLGLLLIATTLSCALVRVTPLPNEISSAAVQVITPVAVVQPVQQAIPGQPQGAPVQAVGTPAPEFTPTPAPTAIPTPTPFLLDFLTMNANPAQTSQPLPRHGLLIAFILPLLICGFPWLMLEFAIIRYVQPRSIDISDVRVKAQDGLFIVAAVSITARRTLTLASARTSWSSVRAFVEKIVEQELIHQALNFLSLDEMERGLKDITENFLQLPALKELSRDFGVEVLRFNIETRYPPETIEALNRRAEASAGGAAYIAFALAAHHDPDSAESRELYRVFQQTTSRVDAARNLGAGIGALTQVLGIDKKESSSEKDDSGD
jgi:hypothetical protein